MAQRTGTFTYDDVCEMPACICDGCYLYIFLRNNLLTSDSLPFTRAVVSEIEQLSTGGVEVTFIYNDEKFPLIEGSPAEMTFGEEGNFCDPDCGSECSWMDKVLRLIENSGLTGLVDRHYIVFADDEEVVSGSFKLPRIPFVTGFRLSDIRVSCFTYNANTHGTIRITVNGTIIAELEDVDFSEQMQIPILSGMTLIAYDQMPVLQLVDVEQTVYGAFAYGLVVELHGSPE